VTPAASQTLVVAGTGIMGRRALDRHARAGWQVDHDAAPGLRRPTHEAPAHARGLPFRRRPAGRHRTAHRRARCRRGDTRPPACRPGRHHRRTDPSGPGVGVTPLADYEVERMYRDQKVCQIYEGTNDIQKLIIARQIRG